MAQYITRDELRGVATELGVVETARVRKAAASRSLAGATFLSHSSKDEELVVGAIRVLENHGGRVYVDEIDPEMPPYTSEETAALLKTRIRDTSRFVLLASKNSKESKWVPWELGIADGVKTLSQIALFPAADSSFENAWASWEYLGLYRRIVWGMLEGYQREVWMVIDEKRNIGVELSKWLNGY
jgi:hypothetical protein